MSFTVVSASRSARFPSQMAGFIPSESPRAKRTSCASSTPLKLTAADDRQLLWQVDRTWDKDNLYRLA